MAERDGAQAHAVLDELVPVDVPHMAATAVRTGPPATRARILVGTLGICVTAAGDERTQTFARLRRSREIETHAPSPTRPSPQTSPRIEAQSTWRRNVSGGHDRGAGRSDTWAVRFGTRRRARAVSSRSAVTADVEGIGMKVVLFCGGMGMRLRDYSDQIPKPLVEVGQRPILWHLMKYYAHYGHKEFILCLGHGATKIKEFFLNYDECDIERLRLSRGRPERSSCSSTDIDDWRITFVDTGLDVDHRRAAPSGSGRTSETTRCSSPTTPTACPTSTRPLCRRLRRARQDGVLPHRAGAAHVPHRPRRRPTTSSPSWSTSVTRPCASTPASSSLRREIFDYMRPGRGACPRTVPAADRRAVS